MSAPPNRLWVVLSAGSCSDVIYGSYRNGQDAEEGMKRIRTVWPEERFKLATYLLEGVADR
jgi:hypothetical protein